MFSFTKFQSYFEKPEKQKLPRCDFMLTYSLLQHTSRPHLADKKIWQENKESQYILNTKRLCGEEGNTMTLPF